jgi:hypothetical protein
MIMIMMHCKFNSKLGWGGGWGSWSLFKVRLGRDDMYSRRSGKLEPELLAGKTDADVVPYYHSHWYHNTKYSNNATAASTRDITSWIFFCVILQYIGPRWNFFKWKKQSRIYSGEVYTQQNHINNLKSRG